MSFSRGSGLFRPFSAWTDEFCRGTMNTAGSLGVENLIIPGDSILQYLLYYRMKPFLKK